MNTKAFLRKQKSRNNHFLDGFLTNPVGFSGMPMDDKGKYDCEAYNL